MVRTGRHRRNVGDRHGRLYVHRLRHASMDEHQPDRHAGHERRPHRHADPGQRSGGHCDGDAATDLGARRLRSRLELHEPDRRSRRFQRCNGRLTAGIRQQPDPAAERFLSCRHHHRLSVTGATLSQTGAGGSPNTYAVDSTSVTGQALSTKATGNYIGLTLTPSSNTVELTYANANTSILSGDYQNYQYIGIGDLRVCF